MAIKILTDSTCDIPWEQQKELGIEIFPLTISFGEKEYIDGKELTKEMFYDMLDKSSVLPKTAQITPYQFEEIFRSRLGKDDEIIGLFISSELSGTHQSACIARNMVDEKHIHIVDTKNVTFGLGLLVLEAVRLRNEGLPARDIYEKLSELKKRVRLFAVVDTLKYLKLGGRLSGTAALIGTLLGIKPVIQVYEGKVLSLSKAKGYTKGVEEIIKLVKKHPVDTSLGIIVGHSNAPSVAEQFKEQAKKDIDLSRAPVFGIGPVVGVHAGPGACGVAYFEKL